MADSGRVRALIVDDEPIARAGLRRMLAEFGWLECAGEAASGPAALESLERLRPELMFLDIEMPGLSGIEVLRQAPHAPLVVFTTAYAEHAVTAFELGALDYLLKPFGPERLAAALERVRAALGEPAPPAFERLRETWSQGPIRRLFVRQGRAIVPLAVESVRCFEAVGDYVAAHAEGGQHLLHVSLQRLEARLDPGHFERIHRTHIVNLDRVTQFRREPDGRLVALLDDGTRLAVSRARAQHLRDRAR